MTRYAMLGGYPMPLRQGGNAGPFGCDPCADCGQRPAAGAPIFWLSTLLLCQPCADRAAAGCHQPEPGAPQS